MDGYWYLERSTCPSRCLKFSTAGIYNFLFSVLCYARTVHDVFKMFVATE